jgi:hypothetical protein
MPVSIDETLLGRWISISWFEKFDSEMCRGFYAFDVGVISNIYQNRIKVCFKEGVESYDVFLQPNNWTSCIVCPPTRQYQRQLLSKKASSLSSLLLCCL